MPICVRQVLRHFGPSPRVWGKPHGFEARAPESADHPHACGENCKSGGRLAAHLNGPSPRAWGKRRFPSRIALGFADHPHACGENPDQCDLLNASIGPSPRAWGKQLDHRAMASADRTIPTRVGENRRPPRRARPRSDHPHARGENSSCRCKRCRGHRADHPHARGENDGIRYVSRSSAPADHPHARGENFMERVYYASTIGPSPRAWGKLNRW